jgi:hypothetical protein
MSSTSKDSADGSRSPWSGIVDAVRGRVPARSAGLLQRLKPGEPDEPVDSASAAGQEDQPAPEPEATPADGGADSQVRAERVSLDGDLGEGATDGAWWPRSDRAADEVAELLDALPDELGRVQRVALSMADWSDERPRVVPVAGHPLHLAWFAGMRRHTVHLTFEYDHTAVLLVVPADADESAARAVLDAEGEKRTDQELLAGVGVELDQGGPDRAR